MNKLRYKFAAFMQGRYGFDEFYKFLVILYAVLIIINAFVNSYGIYLASLIILAYTLFRAFSKNVGKRYAENVKYLNLKRRFGIAFKNLKTRISDKDHVYRKCPHCRATIRFPKRRGKHSARCPRCSKEFKVRVL